MTRILLTGAAGFIGGHVREALTAAEHDVLGLDAYLDVAHGTDPRLDPSIRRADVRDADAVGAALEDVDVVVHHAAMVGAGVSAADAPLYAGHNDLGTAVLLAAMADRGIGKLVLASSMVVYGDGRYVDGAGRTVTPVPRRDEDLRQGDFEVRDTDGIPLRWATVDEDAPVRPRSLYAAAKLAQENYALAWALATGGAVVALRYHNVYGAGMPRDTPYSGVAALFRSALEAGRAPRVFEDGGQMRDFVHVTDVAAANAAAVRVLLGDGVDTLEAFNVASGHPVGIGDVAAILARAARPERGELAPVVTGEYRSGDVRHIVADPARARDRLGFTARIAPEQGLVRFADEPLRG